MTSTTTLTPEQAREIVALGENVDMLVKEAEPTIVAAVEAARRLHETVSRIEGPEWEFTPESHPLAEATFNIAFEADPASVGCEPDSRAGLLTPVRELKAQLAAFLEPFADGDDA